MQLMVAQIKKDIGARFRGVRQDAELKLPGTVATTSLGARVLDQSVECYKPAQYVALEFQGEHLQPYNMSIRAR